MTSRVVSAALTARRALVRVLEGRGDHVLRGVRGGDGAISDVRASTASRMAADGVAEEEDARADAEHVARGDGEGGEARRGHHRVGEVQRHADEGDEADDCVEDSRFSRTLGGAGRAG